MTDRSRVKGCNTLVYDGSNTNNMQGLCSDLAERGIEATVFLNSGGVLITHPSYLIEAPQVQILCGLTMLSWRIKEE